MTSMAMSVTNPSLGRFIVSRIRSVRVSPRKLNLVAKLVRGISVYEALDRLSLCQKRAARVVYSFLVSALSDAENNHGLNPDLLFITEASIGKGLAMKRFRAGSRGRSVKIVRQLSSMRIILHQGSSSTNGTKS